MKQSTILVLALISLSNIVNAGVIRDEHICYNNEGQEIPCKKFISKKEDFGITGHSKRQWDNFNYNSNQKSYNTNQGNWWNRNSWNTLNIKKAVKENNASYYNSGNNNWWNNWFSKSNNSWWRYGNWWNTYDNYPTSNTSNNNNNVQGNSVNAITTKTIPTEAATTKSIPTTIPVSVSIPTPTQASTQAPTDVPAQVNTQDSVSLPIKEFTMTKFSNCSPEQTEILKGLTEDIKTYRAAAVYLLENQKEDETFKKVFLKYYKDENTFYSVQSRFNNINKMASADAYCETNADDACADGAMAWTYLNSKEFHVCPSFFRDAMFGTISKRASEAASIVLHELTHCYGTEDYAYGEKGVNALDATKAAGNADTYRLFAMSSIYYLNEKHHGLTKRDDDFLEESIDFRAEPFKDKVVVRPGLEKRDDDFLNESIDFRSEPFKDEVRVRPNPNLGKRDDDFLNESIDFRSEPFKDEVRVRPNPNQQ
ncbi:hypothetical protein PIROE2DRAFT_57441 [Piromyces sp. E2]|nr:hypothetical protein PIROE2DRAFT_57441 [Piromyces sp. E2]|eukprot:OUM69391.1 hypothetical protein PIROE2DRAFT_57441 [Piromyces sp. E2]